jgi:hypothetical protein
MSSQLGSWNAPLTHQPAAAIMLIAGAAQHHCGDGAMASFYGQSVERPSNLCQSVADSFASFPAVLCRPVLMTLIGIAYVVAMPEYPHDHI